MRRFWMQKKLYKREFVALNDDLSKVDTLNKYITKYQGEKIESKKALCDFIKKIDELNAIVMDIASRAYVGMTINTKDKEAEAKYMHVVENIDPVLDKANFDFQKMIARSKFKNKLNKKKYEIYFRSLANRIKIFREENIPLGIEDSKLAQQYQKISGAWIVKLEGQELTMQQAMKKLYETDRAKREEAWLAIREVQEKDVNALEDIYDKMIATRTKIAKNAGFKNYVDFKFKQLERFEYTPKDCKNFHESIRKLIVPLNVECHAKRAKELGLKTIRPWDQKVDSKGKEPLKPFNTSNELISKCEKIFKKVNKELGSFFTYMKNEKLLDLDSRLGKAPGGYQTDLTESREPFIFMNAVGLSTDVETLLHEGGHAFHAFLARDLEPLKYRSAGQEFSEVASMSMELLGRKFMNEFFPDKEDCKRFKEEQLYRILTILPWIAMLDKFQQWVYENPENKREDRAKKWAQIEDEFRPFIYWGEYQNAKNSGWHYLHLFTVPMYYIEYGIAQLGALQVWNLSKKNYTNAVEAYKKALSCGGTKTLPNLFKAFGGKFDMSEKNLRPIVESIREELI